MKRLALRDSALCACPGEIVPCNAKHCRDSIPEIALRFQGTKRLLQDLVLAPAASLCFAKRSKAAGVGAKQSLRGQR